MPPAGHGVGDDGGEEGFDPAKEGERERVRQHVPYARERLIREVRCGKRARHAAEARADGLDRQAEKRACRRASAMAMRKPGQDGRKRLRRRIRRDAEPAAIAERGGVPGACCRPQGLELGHEGGRLFARQREAEEVAQLARDDDCRDAGGEADDDRVRDVFDVGAEPQEPDRNQDEAGKDRRQKEAIEPLPLDRRQRRGR